MNAAPRWSGVRPDQAAANRNDRECRLNSRLQSESQELRRLRRQRRVQQVNRLRSARVWFEFVDEVVRSHPDIADELDRRLERYAGIDPDMLHGVGADKFAPHPMRVVRSAS